MIDPRLSPRFWLGRILLASASKFLIALSLSRSFLSYYSSRTFIWSFSNLISESFYIIVLWRVSSTPIIFSSTILFSCCFFLNSVLNLSISSSSSEIAALLFNPPLPLRNPSLLLTSSTCFFYYSIFISSKFSFITNISWSFSSRADLSPSESCLASSYWICRLDRVCYLIVNKAYTF